MSGQKTLGLQRADHALKAIEALKDRDHGHYVSYVRALPANILQNGLGQALAMLLAAVDKKRKNKKDDPHQKLYDHIQSWLCGPRADAPYQGKDDLIKAITEGDEKSYLHAHAEALAYLVWLKKFAVAFLKDPEQREAS